MVNYFSKIVNQFFYTDQWVYCWFIGIGTAFKWPNCRVKCKVMKIVIWLEIIVILKYHFGIITVYCIQYVLDNWLHINYIMQAGNTGDRVSLYTLKQSQHQNGTKCSTFKWIREVNINYWTVVPKLTVVDRLAWSEIIVIVK